MDIVKKYITAEENHKIRDLFLRFNSYCNILGYLAQYGSLDTNLFDKKWEEAVTLDKELTLLKQELDKKYHPQDNENYDHYEFDFANCQIIYTRIKNEETI